MTAEKTTPEHWTAEAGARDIARLEIPADLLHDRRFEISVRLMVRGRAGRRDATHRLAIRLDGALEWSRTADTPVDAEDGLEWRSARDVPAGRPLRIVAACELHGAERRTLTIVAEEIR